MKKFIIPVLILIFFGLVFAWQQHSGLPAAAQEVDSPGILQGQTGTLGEATRVVVSMSDTPPVYSAEETQRMQELSDDSWLVNPQVPVGDTAVQRDDSNLELINETQVADAIEFNPEAGINAPGDMVTFRKTILPASSLGGMTSVVGSSSTANSEFIVLETGNWYAAVSGNGGRTFKYIDPRTAFPQSYGGFCCNQVAIYVPSRDIFIWELEYQYDASHSGAIRLAVSRGSDILKGIWYYYDLAAPTGRFFNFSELNLTNDYLLLYFTQYTTAGVWVNSRLLCLDLDLMLGGSPLTYIDFAPTFFGIRGVHGGTTSSYFAYHVTTTRLDLYSWEEGATQAFQHVINLSQAWYDDPRVCPGPDGKNWCGGMGNAGRILTGWVSKGVVGFMWGSSQGGGAPYPYVETVYINESDLTYQGRGPIYNSNFAFIYPGVAINARGDRAAVMNYGGGSLYPTVGYIVWDDFGSGGMIYAMGASTQGPNTNNWGRYNTVRAFAPTNLVWGGTGHYLNGCGDMGCANVVYYIFGRSRDMRSLARYWEPNYGSFMPIVKK